MNWKEFFKPDLKKIILFVLLIFLGFSYGFESQISVSAAIPSDRPYCVVLQAATLSPNVFTYFLMPFTGIVA